MYLSIVGASSEEQNQTTMGQNQMSTNQTNEVVVEEQVTEVAKTAELTSVEKTPNPVPTITYAESADSGQQDNNSVSTSNTQVSSISGKIECINFYIKVPSKCKARVISLVQFKMSQKW